MNLRDLDDFTPRGQPMELRYPTAEARRAAMARLGLSRDDRGFSVRNEADGAHGGQQPVVRIYGPIGGWFGVWADEFAAELDQIDAERITLRVDSPGGSVWDAIAMFNTIRDHAAAFDVFVDSMAASAASFVIQAGDRIVMNPGAELMIHSAWAAVAGNAEELRDFAQFLDRQTLKIARIYQGRAGGTVEAWLEAMAAETWYFAEEAVDAGLADEAAPFSKDGDGDPEPEARLDLRDFGYLYSGRAEAPAPQTSTSVAPEPAPSPPAADEAADDASAAVRQRLTSVAAMAGAALVLADD